MDNPVSQKNRKALPVVMAAIPAVLLILELIGLGQTVISIALVALLIYVGSRA